MDQLDDRMEIAVFDPVEAPGAVELFAEGLVRKAYLFKSCLIST